MTQAKISTQRGITFFGLIFVGAVVGIGGILAAQIFPTYVEYKLITKAAYKSLEGTTVPEVRMIFDKAAAIEDISSIKGKDLDVSKEGEKVVVAFSYQREIHLAGPAWLTMKYAGRTGK